MVAENGVGNTGGAVRVRGLTKSYGSTEVLRGIDFDVAVGEVFGLLGPNGAGKTTAIEILEGYRDRTSGSVSVLGVDPAVGGRAWRERIGLVLQECELDPLMTVSEILRLFSRFYPAPRSVGETIELVGLGDKANARVGTLSGGQRRRVDVGLALIGDPDLVFLDEPTTGFDPSARREAWVMISGLKALGKTVILTTHYMDEAEHLADRVAILRDGAIVATGRPADLDAQSAAGTIIRFIRPTGLSVADVASITGLAVEQIGSTVVLRTSDPQEPLCRLLGHAQTHGLQLAGLDVTHPTLEDVFIELTGATNV